MISLSNSEIKVFSIILPPIGVLDMGLKSERERGGFILGIGIISALLKASGKIPHFSAQFKISQKGVENSGENSYTIFFCRKSLGTKWFMVFVVKTLKPRFLLWARFSPHWKQKQRKRHRSLRLIIQG